VPPKATTAAEGGIPRSVCGAVVATLGMKSIVCGGVGGEGSLARPGSVAVGAGVALPLTGVVGSGAAEAGEEVGKGAPPAALSGDVTPLPRTGRTAAAGLLGPDVVTGLDRPGAVAASAILAARGCSGAAMSMGADGRIGIVDGGAAVGTVEAVAGAAVGTTLMGTLAAACAASAALSGTIPAALVTLSTVPLTSRGCALLPPFALAVAAEGNAAAGRAGDDVSADMAVAVAVVDASPATDGVRLVPTGGSVFPVLVGRDEVPLTGVAGAAGNTPVAWLVVGAVLAASALAGVGGAACRAAGLDSAGGDAGWGEVETDGVVLAAAAGTAFLAFGSSIGGAVGRGETGGMVVDTIGTAPGPDDRTWPIPAVDPINRARKVPPAGAAFNTPQPVGTGVGPVDRSEAGK